MQDGLELKAFSKTDVVAGLQAAFAKLAQAVVQGTLLVPTGGGTIGNLVDSLFGAREAFADAETPESRAWRLVERALHHRRVFPDGRRWCSDESDLKALDEFIRRKPYDLGGRHSP